MNKLLIITISLLIISISYASAACVTPIENLYVNVSMTIAGGNPLCAGTYYLNDSDNNGGIIINNNSIVLEGNNTNLIGPMGANARAIAANGTRNNITIQNINFFNYSYGVRISLINITIQNNTFERGIAWYGLSGVAGMNFYNNTMINSTIYLQDGSGIRIIDNNISCIGGRCGGSSYAIQIWNTKNVTIETNRISKSWIGINAIEGSANTTINNNIMFDNDIAVSLRNSPTADFKLLNNNFTNNSGNYDAYNLAFYAYNSSRINVTGNSINDQIDFGILFISVNHTFIQNNSFDMTLKSLRSQYNIPTIGGEPKTAIGIKRFYKSYSPVCSGGGGYYPQTCMNSTMSSNITLLGNTFDSDTYTKLLLEGDVFLTHDVGGWTFNWSSNLTGYEYSINNVLYNKTTNDVTGDNLYIYFKANSRLFNYSISRLSSSFRGILTNDTFNITFYNLTYPYNDVYNASNGAILATNVTTYSDILYPTEQIMIGQLSDILGLIYAPNLIGLFELNTQSYFDRLIKTVYGNIPRLPDTTKNLQSSFMIQPILNNTQFTITLPLCNQMNAYDNSCNGNTTIDPSTIEVCLASIYGGCTQLNYTYVLN